MLPVVAFRPLTIIPNPVGVMVGLGLVVGVGVGVALPVGLGVGVSVGLPVGVPEAVGEALGDTVAVHVVLTAHLEVVPQPEGLHVRVWRILSLVHVPAPQLPFTHAVQLQPGASGVGVAVGPQHTSQSVDAPRDLYSEGQVRLPTSPEQILPCIQHKVPSICPHDFPELLTQLAAPPVIRHVLFVPQISLVVRLQLVSW